MHAWDIIQPYTNIYIRAWINRCGSYVHDERWQQFALNFNAIATKQNPKHSQNTLFPWTNRIELEISQFLQFCRKTLRCMRFEPNSNALQRNLYGTLFGMLEMLIWIQDTIEALTYTWFGLANCISKLLSNNLIFCWIVIYSLPKSLWKCHSQNQLYSDCVRAARSNIGELNKLSVVFNAFLKYSSTIQTLCYRSKSMESVAESIWWMWLAARIAHIQDAVQSLVIFF